jgi:lysine 2,3-aminomutase
MSRGPARRRSRAPRAEGAARRGRLPAFRDVPDEDWRDWRWQLRHRLDWRTRDVRALFPRLPEAAAREFRAYAERFKVALTPYVLSLVRLDEEGNPAAGDPIWGQFRFLGAGELADPGGEARPENWELPGELPTPILHHKYPDRAILRVVNQCFGHCNYCYLTTRVIDREGSPARAGDAGDWKRSLAYLRAHPEIRDVLLSGGDPLVLGNARLARMLRELRAIPSIRAIRVNTRALTFNPFRFDRELAELFREVSLTALELHVAHPRELTPELDAALRRFDEASHRPLLLWRSPLLAGINDRSEVLEELLVGLYARRITPYYLFHYAPHALGRTARGVSVAEGAALLSALRRRIPGPAFPRYALFHVGGKHDIPLDAGGSAEFRYERDAQGRAIVRFLNWRREWVTYPDVEPAALSSPPLP